MWRKIKREDLQLGLVVRFPNWKTFNCAVITQLSEDEIWFSMPAAYAVTGPKKYNRHSDMSPVYLQANDFVYTKNRILQIDCLEPYLNAEVFETSLRHDLVINLVHEVN